MRGQQEAPDGETRGLERSPDPRWSLVQRLTIGRWLVGEALQDRLADHGRAVLRKPPALLQALVIRLWWHADVHGEVHGSLAKDGRKWLLCLLSLKHASYPDA